MDFEAIILSFYLLFPQLHPWQTRFDSALKKDALSASVKQDVRKEILGVLNSYEASLVPFDAFSQGEEVILNTLGTVAFQYKNSSGKLRLFEFGEEELSVYSSVDGGRGIVSVNGDYVTRTLYDDAFRLVEKIRWKQGAGLPFVANRKTYVYKDPLPKRKFLKKYDSSAFRLAATGSSKGELSYAKPLETYTRMPVSLWDEDFEKKKIQDVKYDSYGNPIRIDFYDVVQDSDSKKEDKVLVKTRLSSFDSSGRVLSEEEKLFFKTMDPLRLTLTKDAFLVRKNVYTYKASSDIPDCNFYEDGVLRMSTVYTGNEDYTETVYFDGGLSIKAFYKDGVKVEEVAYSSGGESYRRKFDGR